MKHEARVHVVAMNQITFSVCVACLPSVLLASVHPVHQSFENICIYCCNYKWKFTNCIPEVTFGHNLIVEYEAVLMNYKTFSTVLTEKVRYLFVMQYEEMYITL